jgi:hypothetical protein
MHLDVRTYSVHKEGLTADCRWRNRRGSSLFPREYHSTCVFPGTVLHSELDMTVLLRCISGDISRHIPQITTHPHRLCNYNTRFTARRVLIVGGFKHSADICYCCLVGETWENVSIYVQSGLYFVLSTLVGCQENLAVVNNIPCKSNSINVSKVEYTDKYWKLILYVKRIRRMRFAFSNYFLQ